MPHHRQHAVVVGASIAGLATARVLADHFDLVTVLDRDELPETPVARKTVPQGRHAHALLAGGARAIDGLFPGIMEELVEGGAALVDFNEGRWYQAGGYRARCLIDRKVIGASRPFIEHHVRRRTMALSNVNVERGVAVDGLAFDGARVRGVRTHGTGGTRTIQADLVVDASGRSSRAPQWLEAIGFARPDEDEVRCDVRYATMVLRRRPDDIEGTFAIAIETPPNGKRASFAIPVEGDRWIATIASCFGAPAPVDEESFRTIAASLPSPEMYRLVTKAEVLVSVATHHLASSRRRRYENLKRVPVGFVALGDAICSFNPIYGQGMSSAVLQAVALGECMRTTGDDALGRAFYKRAAKVIANPWQIAVGADFAYPECTGPKPLGTGLVNRYMKRVLVAARVSAEVNTAMILVQNLLASPTILFRPAMVRTVRRAARNASRQRGGAEPEPGATGSGDVRQSAA